MVRRRGRKRLVTGGRMVLAAVVAGGAWLWWDRGSPSQPENDAPSVPRDSAAAAPPARVSTRLLAQAEASERPAAAPVDGSQLSGAGEPTAVGAIPGKTVADRTVSPAPEGVSSAAEGSSGVPPAEAVRAATESSGGVRGIEDPVRAAIREAQQALSAGDVPKARERFGAALAQDAEGPESDVLREELSRLGTETILSSRIVAGDPLVDRYIIREGDSLARIAGQFLVSPELLARINGLADKNRIRAGQTLKVVKGPFRAVVSKSRFRLDVYVQDTLVKSYAVGLGADGSTPTGAWRVGTKLVNPTYYPPRGGDILSADDPNNPLGERWIGLVGVSGEAVGQERYGLHGTIEPDSIGKNTSMGCIRLRNEDVEELYDFLVEKHGVVTVVE